jgi:hypothetical protein
MALAAVTAKVRVDANATPFQPTPADLFDRTFADAAIGLDRRGMAAFKGNLSALLPAIAADTREIPEEPALSIRAVARFVALSLSACVRPPRPAARPRVGGLVVTSTGSLHQARERVCDLCGTHFAAKASDDVLMLVGGAAARNGGRRWRPGVPAPRRGC